MNYKEIILADFEFSAKDGETPEVICMVAKDLISQKTYKIWEDEFKHYKAPPFSTGGNSLFISYYSVAELSCFKKIGWSYPINNLDLYTEFRNLTNGKFCNNRGLLEALNYFNLDHMDSLNKEKYRQLAMRGGPYTEGERKGLVDYCEEDVFALEKLFFKLKPHIDIDRALLRGEYMKAVTDMESNGIPIDGENLNVLKDNISVIQSKLIKEINTRYSVYEGKVFKTKLFEEMLNKKNISWPLNDNGRLKLDRETFSSMSKSHPELKPLHELRKTISQTKLLPKINVGIDHRNRCMLSPFSSKTGRNQPSNARFIYGPSKWVRSFIKPKKSEGVVYIDWSQQEFGIAAALSKDEKMKEAYTSGDPYLAFAKQAGRVPERATKQSHPNERSIFKECVLAVQYGMGAKSLAQRIKSSELEAMDLLKLHKKIYSVFWNWSDGVLNFAMSHGYLETVFGWRLQIGKDFNERSIRNFPMQANGSEMLRLACIEACKEGIKVCAPIHDALLIESSIEKIEEDTLKTQKIMKNASKKILDGFALKSDAEVFKYPDRLKDGGGKELWDFIYNEINNIKNAEHQCNTLEQRQTAVQSNLYVSEV